MLRPRHAAQQRTLPPDGSRPGHRGVARAAVAIAFAALAVATTLVAGTGSPTSATALGPSPSSSSATGVVSASPAAATGTPNTVAAAVAAAIVAPLAENPTQTATGSTVPTGTTPIATAAARTATAIAAPTATAPPPVSTGTHTPQLAAALTKLLAKLRTKYGIPGVEATIIFADGRSWRAHAGFQDYGARVPVQNATPFPVASVTKTFMAALVVQLAQEGRFGLDDRLVALLPSAKVDARVTIRELLDHTSGVYDFFSNSAIDDAILGCRTCVWTPAKSLSFVKKQLFTPGTGWSYSNTNYVLLGQLVEQVTGRGYASLLRERFFDPLGLVSTFVEGKEAAPYDVVHSYRFTSSSIHAKPTSLWDGTGVGPFRSLATAAGAAGDIASSARDLAVWARALYSGRVLGLEGSKAMLDFEGSLGVRARIPYGLGVEEFTVAGRTAYGHGGRLLGARSAIRYLPSEGMAIAVVINTDRGDPGVIANALATLALPPIITVPLPTPSLSH